MFIVFEGIDGSGKTTISNKVSARLRAAGISVNHVREGGHFASSAAQAIRELGRDARNLMLTPMAELMLYVARDGQSLEEMILPALGSADIVIADRFLYSAQLLATAGRGLPPRIVEQVVAPFAARVQPDLNILVDAPPDLARARRKVSKLRAPDQKPSSRKGLAGGGLQVRMRRAHRLLAEENPERWLIVENHDADLEQIVDAVTAAIATAFREGVPAGLAEGRRRLPPPATDDGPPLATPDDARGALLAWVDRRAASEPDLAAYIIAGIRGDDVALRRAALADRTPIVVAHGLAGLDDLASWTLRHALHEMAPDGVARSLGGLATAESYRWRRRLADRAPIGVVASLHGLDDDEAWALREMLRPLCADNVTASLGGMFSPRAEAARRQWLEALSEGGRELSMYTEARAAARMVSGCSGDLAWKIRKLAFELAPVDVIASMKGDDSPRAWKWRERYAERAPRPVAESLMNMDTPAAWAMRRTLAPHCREVFQTMIGLDGDAAWALREQHADTWPSTVCKSIGALAGVPRGGDLVAYLLGRHRGVSLLRNATKVGDHVARAREAANAAAAACDDAHAVRLRAGAGA
jgi:dTMP kinase